MDIRIDIMDKILVFGSSGGLGRMFVDQVIRLFGKESLVISDYKRERAESLCQELGLSNSPRIIDIRKKESIISGLEGIKGAIIAAKQQTPQIQIEALKKGIITVDVTVFREFIDEVRGLDRLAKTRNTAALVFAGYFPGLSGIAVHDMLNRFNKAEEISVSLLQSTNATTGTVGFLDMLNIVNSPLTINGQKRRGFSLKKSFYHSDYKKDFTQYRIRSGEAELLSSLFGLDIGYYTGWQKASFNRMIKFLNRSGLTHFLANNRNGIKLANLIHPPKRYSESSSELTSLTISGRGIRDGKALQESIHINTKADYLTTVISATTMLKLMLQRGAKLEGGVYLPHQLFTLDDLKGEFSEALIKIEN